MSPYLIYHGSDGTATTVLYEALRARGPIGHIAECLFRAHKTSARAKTYRRRGSRQGAYENKNSSLAQVINVLSRHGEALGFRYGWKPDPETQFGSQASYVLYVDIPAREPGFASQVSYHSPARGEGPDYPGKWDGQRGTGEQRVIELAVHVLTLPESEATEPVMPYGKHRGQLPREVPVDYLRWFDGEVKQMPQGLRDSIRAAIESAAPNY